jgi:cation transport ATPase
VAGGIQTGPSLNASVIAVAVSVHTVSMLAVAGIVAVLFFETYEKSGLQLLRHAWLNFDLLWAIALLVAGFATLLF